MQLHRLSLRNVRGITDVSVDFSENITIISGPNEVGKSTLIEAFDELISTKSRSGKRTIRDMQPVGKDVGPRVEAVFTVGDHKVRYVKQWLKDEETVLEFLDGSEKTVTGDAAHDRAAELWEDMDETLWEASRILQGVAISNAALDESRSLRAALDSQAGRSAEVSDDEGDTIVDRVRDEVNKYYTETRKSLNKDTREVLTRKENAARDLAEATSDLEALDALMDEADQAKARAAEALADLTRAKAEVARLSEETETAQEAAEAVDEARRALAEATRDREDAQRRSTERAELSSALAEIRSELEAAEAELDAAASEREAAENKHAEAEAASTAAEEAADEAAAALEGARRRERRTMRARELAELGEKLELADRLDEQIAQLRAEKASVSAAQAKKIDKLATDLAVEEKVAGRAPSVELTGLASAEIIIDGDSLALAEGETDRRQLADPLDIEVPGKLRITVDPGTRSSENKEIAGLRRKLDKALKAVGAASVDEALEMRAAEEERERKLKEKEAERGRIFSSAKDADETSCRERLLVLRAEASEADDAEKPEPMSIEELEELAEQTAKELSTARAALTRQGKKLEEAKRAHAVVETRLESKRREVEKAEAKLAKAREAASDEQLETELTAATAAAETATERLAAAEEAFEEVGGTGAIDALESARINCEGLADIHATHDKKFTQCEAQLEALKKDEIQRRYDQALIDFEVAERTWTSLDRRASAAKLLEDVLLEKQASARARYVAPLREKINELGRRAMRNETFEVDIDDSLTIAARELDGVKVRFDQLSTGAQEQLAILTRIAVGSLVGSDGGVPIMLDDTLGHSDPERLRLVTEVLGQQTDCQIIILTATDRRFAMIPNATRVSL